MGCHAGLPYVERGWLRASVSVTEHQNTGENGSVQIRPKRAEKGETVTVTVKPDTGYEMKELVMAAQNGKVLPVKPQTNKQRRKQAAAWKNTQPPVPIPPFAAGRIESKFFLEPLVV